MKNKKIRSIICTVLTIMSLTLFTGCGKSENSSESVSMSEAVQNVDVQKLLSSIKVEDDDSSYDEKATITLNKDSISVDGEGAKADGSKVTITSGGLYKISGELTDGQIIIKAGDDDKVKLELDGVKITCSNNSALCVENAKKTVLNIKEDTENTIEDGSDYDVSDDNKQNATIYSKDDLIIDGTGTLNVNGNYKNGIASKDDITIVDCKLSINAKNDGIKGNDSVGIKNADITVKADGDGIQSSNDSDSEKGYVLIESGKLNITSALDGIQAETVLAVRDGDINIVSGGGSKNATKKTGDFGGPNGGKGGMKPSGDKPDMKDMPQDGQRPDDGDIPQDGQRPDDGDMPQDGQRPDDGNMPQDGQRPDDGNMPQDDSNQKGKSDNNDGSNTTEEKEDSKKGLKSTNNITIENGNITIDSADDTMHSNSSVNISNGKLNLTAGDDGIHADSEINISGAEININNSYEGIESTAINVSGGEIKIKSSDDGINGTGTVQNTDDSNGGRNGGMDAVTDAMVKITGGYIYIDASGDGLDSNGNVEMSDGTVIINGPTNDGNGALDYNGTFNITGGTLVAAGSLGMAQAPSDSSTQNSVSIGLTETQEANSIISIQDTDGNEILTFSPAKTYTSVVVSSSKLEENKEYKVLINGSSDGQNKDGLYSDGKYTGGTEFKTFKVSSSTTNVGQTSRMGNGNGDMKGRMDRRNNNQQSNTDTKTSSL